MVARRALPVLIALLPAVVPATASAATSSRAPGSDVLTVSENGAETNNVTITLSGGVYTMKDEAGMGAGANCSDTTPGDPTTVTCPAGPVASISANLGSGNDRFVSMVATPATVSGGAGQDAIEGGFGVDNVDGNDGNDVVSGGEGPDVVRGGDGNDHVGGVGERDNDNIDGGPGDDVLEPGDGAAGPRSDDDSLAGGPGTDEVRYATRTTPVVVTIDGVANDGQAGEHDDVKSDVEVVTGGSAGDELRGSANPETLNGGPGGDLLAGGGGDDLVMGGDGDDHLDGDAPGLPGAPKRQASAGDKDTLDGGDGNDTMTGGPGADRIIGGPGIDGMSYANALSPVFATLDGKPDDGELGEGDSIGADVENLAGSARRDTFTGSGAGNAMTSAGGEDYLDGAGGPDAMAAGGGFDVVRARDGEHDTVDCGSSRDFAILDKGDTASKSCERTDRGQIKRPALGRFLLVKPLRGGEAFGLRGMHRFVPLKDSLGLPPGMKLDATEGAVRLTAANARGGSQTGDFSQGAFLVKQPKSARGLTELTLTGGDLTKCANAKGQVRAAASHKVVRRLFGRAHGRFRTRGRNSTATVRGTEWTVVDRCDGTLTTVRRGTVVVRDRVKHRTVILRSGQRYLARRGNR